VFTDDLSMQAAAEVGDMQERLHLSLHAGCDMALVCNDRDAVLSLLDNTENKIWQQHAESAVIQKRLASLYAKPTFSLSELKQSAQWQEASSSMQVLKSKHLSENTKKS